MAEVTKTHGQSTDPSLENILRFTRNPENVDSETIKTMYDRWAGTYDENVINVHEYQAPSKVGELFAANCQDKDVCILDCGAGTGLVAEKLHAHGFTNIVGIDISQKSLDAAAQKGVYKRLVCADVGKEKMPFRDDEFGGLVCSGCLAPSHMRPNCLRDWVRVVKSGGIIILIMRQAYVELVKGEEEYYNESYKDEFDTVIEELNAGKRWQLTKLPYPGYLKGTLGLVLVAKVL